MFLLAFHNAQSLRLFGLHRDVNDAHRAGANRLQNKQKQTSSLSPTSLVLLSSSSRRSTAGWYTGYEPIRIELDRNLVNPQNQTSDDQDDMEQIGVKQSSYCKSLTHSTFDSAESIGIPLDSDFEDEQKRRMLASPSKIQEREENDGQARAYHSERESLMIHCSRDPEVSGKPDAECVQKRQAIAQRT